MRACLILRVFALTPLVLARLLRAKEGVSCVENALRAFSTQLTKSGECRRRKQAIVTEIR